ncbi:hypothetical protein OAT67_05985 [Bacteriovoracaceae bacterium]|nr:hypothetical protein [Bacteriovoracaceae bacterium]|tara:strand:- start:204800 stop:205225 length:426 start_codon:yes stop_codon:yes gene_type:complete
METLLQKIITQNKYRFQYEETFQDVIVDITLPDLNDMPVDSWGDWGPMYNFQLNSDFPIALKVMDKENRLLEKYKILLPSLSVESPFESNIRKEFPLFISIPINERNSKLELYFNTQAELSKVEIKKINKISDSIPSSSHE